MEAEIKAGFPDAQVQLIRGSGGIFDVKRDGKLIYSKYTIGGDRFPREGEIRALIAKAGG